MRITLWPSPWSLPDADVCSKCLCPLHFSSLRLIITSCIYFLSHVLPRLPSISLIVPFPDLCSCCTIFIMVVLCRDSLLTHPSPFPDRSLSGHEPPALQVDQTLHCRWQTFAGWDHSYLTLEPGKWLLNTQMAFGKDQTTETL